MPQHYFGRIPYTDPILFGLIRRSKAIPMFLDIDQPIHWMAEGTAQFSATATVHDSSPAIGTAHDVQGTIDFASRRISFEDHAFAFDGVVADGMKRIRGSLKIKQSNGSTEIIFDEFVDDP